VSAAGLQYSWGKRGYGVRSLGHIFLTSGEHSEENIKATLSTGDLLLINLQDGKSKKQE